VAQVIGARGLRPVLPASPAVDFTLTDLGGQSHRLSDWRGNWVLLTFFATWCGPCAMEMPSLQALHELEHRVQVVGVATDGQRDLVQSFADGHKIRFPVLVDDGQVAQIYRASSIPTSYIISPEGRIVAIARGARDWRAERDTFVRLAEIIAPNPETVARYAEKVELPLALVPPEARARIDTATPRAGQDFRVLVDVTWAGNLNDYLLLPPQLTLPEGVTQLGTEASSSSAQGRATITYQLRLRASAPGEYALDPVLVRYQPRLEREQLSHKISGPRVTVVAHATLLLPVGAGALALLVLGAAGAWRLRRKPAATVALPAEDLQALLHKAQAARSAGDIGTCLAAIGALDRLIGTPVAADFESILEQARYGGQVPPRHVIDGWLHRAEREVAMRQREGNP
jgi:peroxiredoxin